MAAGKYKAVFFDAGGTLFQPHPSVGHLYAVTAVKYGMHVDAEEMEHLFREEFALRDRQAAVISHATERNEKEWWKSLVRDVFAKVTELRRFDEYFDDLYDLFARAEAWKIYPEVPELLDELKRRKLILGIVSNWDSRLHSICSGMRLEGYFDFILASAVVGSAKPDGGIFAEALRRAGIAAAEAIHVGDSVENDFWGARNAGIDALFISRSGRRVEGVTTISSLTEVLRYF